MHVALAEDANDENEKSVMSSNNPTSALFPLLLLLLESVLLEVMTVPARASLAPPIRSATKRSAFMAATRMESHCPVKQPCSTSGSSTDRQKQ